MAVICPTVTARDPHEYREQMERIARFAKRIHIDFMDGLFALSKSPSIDQAWWPHSIRTDLHLMYKRPDIYLDKLIELEPSLVVIHAEAEGEFGPFAEALHKAGIKVGVALLPKTQPALIEGSLDSIDHVLIFSGHLGQFGGKADLDLLDKAKRLKKLKPGLEIGWDGGINRQNVAALVEGGVDVLNVGGFIQKADNAPQAYKDLLAAV